MGCLLMLLVVVLLVVFLLVGIVNWIVGIIGVSLVIIFLMNGGLVILNNLVLLFVVGLVLGMLKDKDGLAVLVGLVVYLVLKIVLVFVFI